MTKNEIAEIFESIARLLEIKGENPFKIRAYTNAARALETLAADLPTLVEEGRLEEVDGIGKAIAEKITELVRTGRLEFFEKLQAEFPAGILSLFELNGLGGKKIKALYQQLQVASLEDLEKACRDGRIAALAGFGPKSAENFLRALEQRQKHSGQFLFAHAAEAAEILLEDLKDHSRVGQAQIAGSYRRKKEIVRDLDFIVSTRRPEEVAEHFVTHPLVETVLAQGKTKSSVVLKSGLQCDLRTVTSEEFPFALNYFTGSKEHNIRLRSRALERGWSLNEYRFSEAEGRELREPIPEIQDEREIYRALGLDYVEPELREDHGEFDAAENGELPNLVQWTNLRGTFHNHTTESDGRNSLAEMAEAALDLGLDYLGIADHSKSSVQAHGLDEARLAKQCAAIDEWNAERGEEIHLFKGTECDILKDGSLDFSDEVLAGLDYVVASVHSSFTLSELEMTKRIIRAAENPHVTMLGHLTGRLLLSREPYALNIPAILDACADTGTIIELNANPLRLDLDWRWWKLAKAKGVKCSINPDAHSTAGLRDLIYGIHIARKGWLTRQDVINTLPMAQIQSQLKRKTR